jgi:hypothetical protein
VLALNVNDPGRIPYQSMSGEPEESRFVLFVDNH